MNYELRIMNHRPKAHSSQLIAHSSSVVRIILITCLLLISATLPSAAQFDINHYLREGYADLNKSNYTSAINRFNTIIQVKPEMLEPYYFRGFCKYRLDDY